MAARCVTRNPTRLSWRSCQSAVQTHPTLRDDEGFSRYNPFVESFIELGAFVRQNAQACFYSGPAQNIDPSSRMARVYVDGADDYGFDAGLDNLGRTGRCAAGCGAWFERDV